MKRKIVIKASTLLLTAILLLFVASIFASNIILKRQYNRTDKSDIYWNYGKILEQPFRHVVIEGGNVSGYTYTIIDNIVFEQSEHPSVRVLKNWDGYEKGSVKASVKNDTLFIHFPEKKSFGEFDNQKSMTLVRIFAPEIISIDGYNTSIWLSKLTQKNLVINMSKGSQANIQRSNPDMDSITIHAKDSSVVKFVMYYLYKGKTMKVNTLHADLQGASLLDLGNAQINSLALNMSDSAAIMLSGDALKKLKE